MSRSKRTSPALVISILALVAALVVPALAQVATTALTKKEKRVVRKIARSQANKQITRRAPSLKTSSGFDENAVGIDSLGGNFVNVASAAITTHSTGRILASGSAQLVGDDSNEVGQCFIDIDGNLSAGYSTAPDDLGFGNPAVIAINFGVTRPPGTYTAKLFCYAVIGIVGMDSAAISVIGVGA